jgi:PAS domain S-box-containing protein
MHFNRLTLAFAGAHDHIEPDFKRYYFQSTLNQIRIAVFAAFIFYAAFGALDRIIIPERYYLFWMIRWAVVCPVIMTVFLFSYSRFADRYFQPVLSLTTLICGLGIIAMVQLAAPYSKYSYVGGLVQIIFYIFTFSRLRFIWGTTVVCLLVPAYLIVTTTVGSAPQNYIIGKAFHLSLIGVMGMMAGYAIEYQTRKNFFLSRQLESKKRRLAMANDFLEERVASRTVELNETNAMLKEEINERKLIELALRDSQKRFSRMVNNVTDHMCVYDLDGNILEANRQMINGLGYSLDELVHIKYYDLIIPDERAAYYQYLTDIRRKGTISGDITLSTRSGEPRYFEYSNVLGEHTNGHAAIFSLARDITHRKKTEKALADSQMRFKNVFETAAAGMAIIEGRTRTVVEINRAGAQMTRFKIKQLSGRCIDDLIAMPEETEYPQMPVPTSHPVECLLTTSAGEDIPILASTQTTVLNDRPHWIISFVDIQKIKEAEAAQRELELRSNRAQHLESIGTLAGGIAHDFNNILFGIMGFAELALEDAQHGSTQAKNLEEILKGGYRAKDMIAQILTYSRQDRMEKTIIQPAPLIKEALKLLRASLPSTIEIQSRFVPKLGNIKVNPAQLHQIIMNLCTNAAHALMDESGTIDISMDNITLGEDRQTAHGLVLRGEYVRLKVKDNGVGIRPDIIDRIFEPFYTTKSQGQGSGLGLSVVLGIVQSNHGSITVESRMGQGTCFEVLLPLIEGADENTHNVETIMPRGRENILVVDDEPPLLRLLTRMLTSLGYQVTTCEHPAEALAVFNSRPRFFDLVLTDLTMPKKLGTTLAQELLQSRPNLPIILSTGNGNKISKEILESIGIRKLLLKPILKRDLASSIRHVLDAA